MPTILIVCNHYKGESQLFHGETKEKALKALSENTKWRDEKDYDVDIFVYDFKDWGEFSVFFEISGNNKPADEVLEHSDINWTGESKKSSENTEEELEEREEDSDIEFTSHEGTQKNFEEPEEEVSEL